MLTRCGNTDECSSCDKGIDPDEQRLPNVMAAYDLSSGDGWSRNSRMGVTQPLSTMAPACCGLADSCESAERAWSWAFVSWEESCSASITSPPDSYSCSALCASPGHRSATSEAARFATRAYW